MNKVRLQYMVDPDELKKRAYIKNPVRIIITHPKDVFLLGILGESGRKLVQDGIPFYFERKRAEGLVKMGLAKFLPKKSKAEIVEVDK